MPTQVEKLRKFQGAGGSEKHALEWKFQGSGGSKAKVPFVGAGGGRYGYFLELHIAPFVGRSA